MVTVFIQLGNICIFKMYVREIRLIILISGYSYGISWANEMIFGFVYWIYFRGRNLSIHETNNNHRQCWSSNIYDFRPPALPISHTVSYDVNMCAKSETKIHNNNNHLWIIIYYPNCETHSDYFSRKTKNLFKNLNQNADQQ